MKAQSRNQKVLWCMAAFIGTFTLLFAFPSWGEGPSHMKVESTWPEMLSLSVGKSLTLEVPGAVKRIALASPDIADALVVAPRQLYIIGKSAGTTNLTIWEKDDRVTAVINLEVAKQVPENLADKQAGAKAAEDKGNIKPPLYSVEVIKGSTVSEVKFEMFEMEEETR